ncbi:hypothetical protein HPB52_019437 [Rhipicephalus sanguineus]|uniref:Uncharacterized protein n=1 Tax=Rhipicephalus sanguineus TaxID=34632 RepID=A0A9D4QC31_RHISA|nr:hypothetical protein HPB52_019437 [Rhipicephalus sanguineus]
MAIVDSNCQYIRIDVGPEGRQSDGLVLKNSKSGEKLLKGTLGLPPTGFLPGTRTVASYAFVGDEAF